MANYPYAWRHGYKWALKSANPIAFIRVLWLAYILGWDCESCYFCGRRYMLWWCDDDKLWEQLASKAGLCCPNCFDKRARKLGFVLRWKPEQLKEGS